MEPTVVWARWPKRLRQMPLLRLQPSQRLPHQLRLRPQQARLQLLRQPHQLQLLLNQ
jgi:hypothetical protein